MPETYDVTIVTVRPGTHPQALAVLGKSLADDASLLACWYSDIGAVNQILVIRKAADAYNRTRLTPFVKKLFNSWLAWTR